MSKHATLTLQVPLIDFAIAKLEGLPLSVCAGHLVYRQSTPQAWLARTRDGREFPYSPCLDWRLGGPLIQKHEVSFQKVDERWHANIHGKHVAQGKTPLIACLRSVLHKHFGETLSLELPPVPEKS